MAKLDTHHAQQLLFAQHTTCLGVPPPPPLSWRPLTRAHERTLVWGDLPVSTPISTPMSTPLSTHVTIYHPQQDRMTVPGWVCFLVCMTHHGLETLPLQHWWLFMCPSLASPTITLGVLSNSNGHINPSVTPLHLTHGATPVLHCKHGIWQERHQGGHRRCT